MKVALLLFCVLLSGCNTTGRWVYQEDVREVRCPGGRIDQERRIVDVINGGRTRNTVVRTNACLD